MGIIVIAMQFAFQDTLTVDVKLDGENVTVSPLSLSFNGNINDMKLEMENFTYTQMNDIDSDITTLKNGLNKIANKHGFSDVTINVNSQFGENIMPIMIVVGGTGMIPTLQDGERIIVEKTNNVKIGDIVLVNDSQYGLLMKRLGNISEDQIFIYSDNNDTAIKKDGVPDKMVGLEKWTSTSNIIRVAKIFNV